jgi:hypothetical protein
VAHLFQRGLAGLLRVGQHSRVHVDHHLVPLAGRAGIEAVMQRGLGEQGQRVRLLLRPRRGLQCGIARGRQAGREGRGRGPGGADPLIQRLPSGVERAQQQLAHLGGEPPAEHHGAVVLAVDVERPARVLLRDLTRLGLPVHPPPAADDPLHVDRRAGAADGQQASLGVRRGYAGQGANLGVGELATGQGLSQPGQRRQRAGDPDALAGRAHVEADSPGEPVRARAEASVPASARVELADQGEEARGGGIDVRR